MTSLPLTFTCLVGAFILVCWLNACETAAASANHIRLKQLARQGDKTALRLLQHGSGLFAGLLVLLLCARLMLVYAAFQLTEQLGLAWYWTLVWLVPLQLSFAELAPKALGRTQADRLLPILYRPIRPMLLLTQPLQKLTFRLQQSVVQQWQPLANLQDGAQDELLNLLHEHQALQPDRQGGLLLDVLALSEAHVEDIMVPRMEISAIDVQDDWKDILHALAVSQHSRILLFRDNLDDVVGFLHTRDLMRLQLKEPLTKATLLRCVHDVYFVPLGTTLAVQLHKFQQTAERVALVVDEFGDIKGLITLEDILAELLSQLQPQPQSDDYDLMPQLIDATTSLRELNRKFALHLPTDGPKTLNGLMLELLEQVPEAGAIVHVDGYQFEVVKADQTMIQQVRLRLANHQNQLNHDD